MNIKMSRVLFAFVVLMETITSCRVFSATVVVACDSVGNGARLCKEGTDAWAKKTGNTVRLVLVPASSSERLNLYQQLLIARSPMVDVYMIDIIWSGVLSNYFVDLTKPAAETIKDHFPAIMANNIIHGRLIAMPWFADTGLLYYRKDLLRKYGEKVPVTWENLRATARKIQAGERKAGNKNMWGYVWQGKSYEGLTCNAIEWIASYNGGTIVDIAGKVTIDNSGAIKAMQMAKSLVGDISPKEISTYGEEEAFAIFQSGNSAFMRNWPYAWAAVNKAESPIKDEVGVVALPKGGESGQRAATLGGQELAVSRFSKNADISVDLVMYLTSAEEQKRRAIVGSYNPTIEKLYRDSQIVAANPFQAKLYSTLVSAVARPSTVARDRYTQVSSKFRDAVYGILFDGKDAALSLKELDSKLNDISVGEKW